jgi:uncharacterized protein with GYD domain
MPKYLVRGSYTAEGTRGLLKDGGTKRRAAVEGLMKGIGGTVESFYYAFGDADVYVIVDGPDNVSAAAVSLAVNASGLTTVTLTPLLTAEEIDRATKKAVRYQGPGQ